MSAARLLEQFDRVAEAPDAIPRLRRFVLDLAVRGKLVEQDPTDEPASELLKRIAKEKGCLIKTGTIKKPRDLPHENGPAAPFQIPTSWQWCRLDSIGAIIGGGTPRSSDTENFAAPGKGIPWLTPADLGGFTGYTIVRGARDLSKKGLQSSSATLMPKGTVLFTSRAPIGYVAISEDSISTNQGFKSIVPYVAECAGFIALAMRAFVPEIEASASGTTFKEVSGKVVAGIAFPLPPLAEQHRIVAKVDELMALLDRLETARTRRETTRKKLTTAGLTRLTRPDANKRNFRTHARFTLDTLPAITTHPDQIKTLRQTILDLAVRGKLVEQDPSDEPASELLKRISEEKERLAKAGEIRKQKMTTPESMETPCKLPEGWMWTRIAELGVISPRNTAFDDQKASFVPMPMISAEYGVGHSHEIRPWGDIKKGYTHFSERDVGLAKITPCFENGKSTVFRNLVGGIGAGTTELHIVRPLFVSPDYIALFLKSPHFIETGIPKMTGTAGQKRVPKEYFTDSPFPLPPLAEQHRIVAKVDELMTMCSQIETALTASKTSQDDLLEILLCNSVPNTEEDKPIWA